MKGLINAIGEIDSLGGDRTGEIRGLVKFRGKPVVSYIIKRMKEAGASEVLVLANEEHAEKYRSALYFSQHVRVLGCGVMSPFFAYMHGFRKLKGDDVLAVADDNLFDFSLAGMVGRFQEVDDNVLAVRDLELVTNAEEAERLNFGRVVTDASGKVTSASFSFAPQTQLKEGKIALDIYLIHRKRIPQFERMMAHADLDYATKNWWKNFHAVVINEGFWADIGKPELRRRAEEYFEKT